MQANLKAEVSINGEAFKDIPQEFVDSAVRTVKRDIKLYLFWAIWCYLFVCLYEWTANISTFFIVWMAVMGSGYLICALYDWMKFEKTVIVKLHKALILRHLEERIRELHALLRKQAKFEGTAYLFGFIKFSDLLLARDEDDKRLLWGLTYPKNYLKPLCKIRWREIC